MLWPREMRQQNYCDRSWWRGDCPKTCRTWRRTKKVVVKKKFAASTALLDSEVLQVTNQKVIVFTASRWCCKFNCVYCKQVVLQKLFSKVKSSWSTTDIVIWSRIEFDTALHITTGEGANVSLHPNTTMYIIILPGDCWARLSSIWLQCYHWRSSLGNGNGN